MSISSVGAAPYSVATAAAAPLATSDAGAPSQANAQDSGDGAVPLPPVQAATAPGTGQKIDIIA